MPNVAKVLPAISLKKHFNHPLFKIMRTILLSAMLVVSTATILSAQPFGSKEVKEPTTIIWYGLDFSMARLIGAEGFADPYDIKNRFFPNWNRLIVDEADKYDLKKTFLKSNLEYELTVVEDRNKEVRVDDLVTENDYSITEADVAKIVKAYKSSKFSSGLGLVFIVESFNKKASKGNIWVTFFDIASGKVLLTRKYSGDARGFGLRNYWAGSIYKIMGQCEEDYKKWLKKN